MENEFSKDFQKYFLLKFTSELIWHSEKKDIANLQNIIKLKEESKEKTIFIPSTKESIESAVSIQKYPSQILTKEIIPPRRIQRLLPQRQMKIRSRASQILIPEPRLPEHLEYLKPIPRGNIEIDLFKINPLINDPAVKIIEVNENQGAIVSGTMGTRPTSIILNKEDINRIINKFSEISKIPISEGIYKVVAGNLIISAVISEIIGSRFVIEKMPVPKEFSPPQRELRVR